jgi:hypothetical protein
MFQRRESEESGEEKRREKVCKCRGKDRSERQLRQEREECRTKLSTLANGLESYSMSREERERRRREQ